jgi:hypothetical protein
MLHIDPLFYPFGLSIRLCVPCFVCLMPAETFSIAYLGFENFLF